MSTPSPLSDAAPASSPLRRRSRRLLHHLLWPWRRFRGWYVHQPRAIRVGLVAVILTGLVAGLVYARVHVKKRGTERATATSQREFNEAARKCDLDAMRVALDGWAAANPDDPTPAKYRSILDRGEADPDTPELATVMLSHHVTGGRLPEAAREAEKVLAKYPKHWQARCALAHYALQVQRDPAKAQEILDRLPNPEDPEADVRIGGVLYALRLFDVLGRDGGELRRLIVRRLIPLTRSAAVAEAPAVAKVQIIACYLEPFSDPTALTELGSFWAAADKLAEDATAEAVAAGDVPTLIRLAEMGPGMRVALAQLRDHDPNRLPPERFEPLQQAIDDRTRRAWLAVRAKMPKRPEPYKGLALISLQTHDPVGALQVLIEGLTACGDRPEFLELLIPLVARFGTDESVRGLADAVWKNAESAQNDPAKWCLAAQVALVVRRHDAALAACRRALALRPGHPWACATQAQLLVRVGKFFEAREALAPLGDAVLVSPALTRLHGTILVGSGLWILRDEEFKKVTEAQAKLKPKTSLPAVGFLHGVLDAPLDAERAGWVAATAELLRAADPGAPQVLLVKAEALTRLAELSATPHPENRSRPPVWNAARVTAALRAVAELPPELRAEPNVIAAVALLQLKGQGDSASAMRTVSPLLASEATATGGQLEVLGAVLAANDRTADSLRVLQRASRLPGATPGCLVSLAIAYQKNRQPIEARAVLAEAEAMPNRSDREQAELVAAKILLQENP